MLALLYGDEAETRVGERTGWVDGVASVLVVGGYGDWSRFAFVVGFSVECELSKEGVLVCVPLGRKVGVKTLPVRFGLLPGR
jgi:hypothetical protein